LLDSGKVSVKCATIGPRISRRVLIVTLALVLAALLLSVYVRSRPSNAELFCRDLDRRTESELVWDGDGCLMKTRKDE
jgi:hypothetical protein